MCHYKLTQNEGNNVKTRVSLNTNSKQQQLSAGNNLERIKYKKMMVTFVTGKR